MIEKERLVGEDEDGVWLRVVWAYLQSLLQESAPSQPAREAWEKFYRSYGDLLRSQVHRYDLPAAETEAVVREVWVGLVARMLRPPGAEQPAGLRAWVVQVVHDKAMDRLQRRVPLAAGGLEGVREGNHRPT